MITRKVVKQTVMTSVYGVTFVGARAQILARLEDQMTSDGDLSHFLDEKNPESLSWQTAGYITRITLSALDNLFQEARNIMSWLGDCAKSIAKQGHPISWISPIGLPIIQPYRNAKKYTVKTVLQSVTLSHNPDFLPVNTNRQKSAFPPNFVHSLDSSHMVYFTLVTVALFYLNRNLN